MSIPFVCQATVSDPMACLLGIATVFAGLIVIIAMCKIIGWLCNLGSKPKADSVSDNSPAPSVNAAPAEIPNRRETVAAIAAAIAEENGTDVSAIRILSIEKM